MHLLERMGVSPQDFAWRGSKGYLPGADKPSKSEAAPHLVELAMRRGAADEPLYVVAIGAITNVASAILLEPEIIRRIVIVWLGGHALHWHDTLEFNLMQDVHAARLVLDCGVPLVQIPVMGVTSHLHTTIPELERYVQGRGAIGDYLVETVKGYHADHYAWSKVIWDISSIAYLLNEAWVPTGLVHSPVLTDQVTWSFDVRRHLIRSAWYVHRDPIFRDLFTKLEAGQHG